MILTPACRAPWFSHDVETAGRPETCCFDPVVINEQKTQLMYLTFRVLQVSPGPCIVTRSVALSISFPLPLFKTFHLPTWWVLNTSVLDLTGVTDVYTKLKVHLARSSMGGFWMFSPHLITWIFSVKFLWGFSPTS